MRNPIYVRFYLRSDAEDAIRYINGTRLDDRIIRTDLDAGFVEGRQYGRGKTGGQVFTILFTLQFQDLTPHLFFR